MTLTPKVKTLVDDVAINKDRVDTLTARPKPAPAPPPLTVLKRQTIPAVNLAAGSTLELNIMPEANSQTLNLTATQAMTATEQVLFETVFEGRKAIGGFILASV